MKEEIIKALKYVKPVLSEKNKCHFLGWSKMCAKIESFMITGIGEPALGCDNPSYVHADLALNLQSAKPAVLEEWYALRKKETLFLVHLKPTQSIASSDNRFDAANSINALSHVRGCEIIEIYDENSEFIDFSLPPHLVKKPQRPDKILKFKISFCPKQFYEDQMCQNPAKALNDLTDSLYYSFDLVMRRKSEANNSKFVLNSLIAMLTESYNAKSENLVPNWFEDVLIGIGDPNTANALQNKDSCRASQKWGDTFVDYSHLRNVFENDLSYQIQNSANDILNKPPYTLKLNKSEKIVQVSKSDTPRIATLMNKDFLANDIKFNGGQTEAISSAMCEGVTIVVGPPGTGKTDVAVQSIMNIFRNEPKQRILLITHSNNALNQLFMKLINQGFPEEFLLRLGHGEVDLETDKNFSVLGRVEYILSKRKSLLAQVKKLVEKFDTPRSEQNLNCQVSHNFFLQFILPIWQSFYHSINFDELSFEEIVKKYPFQNFEFEKEILLRGAKNEGEDCATKRIFENHYLDKIQLIFDQLEIIRPFEYINLAKDRKGYLLTKQAKIIAMTCTHAAINFEFLRSQGFSCDSLVFEEAGQMLDIESFIPIALNSTSNQNTNSSLLKVYFFIGKCQKNYYKNYFFTIQITI